MAITGCGAGTSVHSGLRETVRPSFMRVAGPPFGTVVTADGHDAFVDLVNGRVLLYS